MCGAEFFCAVMRCRALSCAYILYKRIGGKSMWTYRRNYLACENSYYSSTAACAAAKRAMGTRKGEQDT